MTDDAPTDITFHYPPELFNLLVDVVPLLNRSKQDVLVFFRGAGVPDNMTSDVAAHLRVTPKDVNKYQMVRTVLERLNAKGEHALRERREVLRRVVDFANFDSCWPRQSSRPRALSLVSAKSLTRRRFHAHEQCPRRRTTSSPRRVEADRSRKSRAQFQDRKCQAGFVCIVWHCRDGAGTRENAGNGPQ